MTVLLKNIKMNNYTLIIDQASQCSSGESRLATRVLELLLCVTINASNHDDSVTWQEICTTEAVK